MISLSNSALWRRQLYIDGQWLEAADHKQFAVLNPATGKIIAQVADGGELETLSAIAAADAALPSWKNTSVKMRSAILRKWFDLVIAQQQDLALILTAEQGKLLVEAQREIVYGASYIEWFAEEAKRVYGDIIAPPSDDKRILVLKQPVGVVACITPWNFPSAMLARKLAPALAAGCTLVLKPAAQTPLSALALVALAEQAGVPPGVINIVCGSHAAAIGKTITSHPLVRKLSFTGSTEVGKQLLQQTASSVKKVTLELGGNAPFIVFEDADVDAAVAGAMAAKFRNSGQTCICVNRFYIHADIYSAFVEKFSQKISQLRLGDGMSEAVTLGPLISPEAVAKVQRLVDDALAKGAVQKQLENFTLADNLAAEYFYPPTLLLDVPGSANLCREEIFGPVAALIKFSTEAEVIALANDTEFGLAGYFYSGNTARIWRLAEQLELGMVGVNDSLISNEMAPFGGVKQSGWGREGSRYGIEDYLQIKYVCMGNLT